MKLLLTLILLALPLRAATVSELQAKWDAKFDALKAELHADLESLNAPPAEPTNEWNDPATWGGAVPGPDQNVTIEAGKTVKVKGTVVAGNIMVHGTLTFDDTAPVIFTVGSAVAMGTGVIEAGIVAAPRTQPLLITLTGDETIPGMGQRVIGAMGGGRLTLIGQTSNKSWTMLSNNAEAGASQITLDSAPGWAVGDSIIITSTSIDPNETEQRTITAITGATITLNAPLQYSHNGTIRTVDHNKLGVPTSIDTRAEVALLTRRIRIEGSEDGEATLLGGHLMTMDPASRVQMEGVELYRMGQGFKLGRYPFHRHNGGDDPESFIRKCSAHHSFNRLFTVHKTNGMTVSENVGYNCLGHGIFLEDGKEVDNLFERNLIALCHPGTLIGRHDDVRPSGIWISNPNNDFIGNVVAGVTSNGIGIWYDVPEFVPSNSISADPNYRPREQPFGINRGTRVHSMPGANDWAIALEFSNGGEHLVEDFTSFANAGPVSYCERMLTGALVFERAAVACRLGFVKGNTILRNGLAVMDDTLPLTPFFGFMEGTTSLLLQGYDGTPNAQGCVIKGFGGMGGIMYTINSLTGQTWLDDCLAIDSNITPPLLTSPATKLLAIADPKDTFHNGAPGTFANQPYGYDPATDKLDAPGLGATDTAAYWSPAQHATVVIYHDAPTSTIKRPGGTAYPLTNNVIAEMRAATPYEVSVGKIQNIDASIFFPGSTGAPVIFTVPKPAGFAGIRLGDGPRFPPAASLAAFNAATGSAYFVEGETLHLKMHCAPAASFWFEYE